MVEYTSSQNEELAGEFEAIYVENKILRIRESLRVSGTATCIICGDDIPEARRKANSSSKTCIPCQTDQEKRQKLPTRTCR